MSLVRRISAVLLIAGAACSSGPKAYSTAGELVAALQKKGIPCDYQPNPFQETEAAIVGAKVKQSGTCDVAPLEEIEIRMFANAADRDQFLAAMKKITVSKSAPDLVGPTWIISTALRTTVDRVQKAIGGKIGSS